jgi:hypothetical protein
MGERGKVARRVVALQVVMTQIGIGSNKPIISIISIIIL